MNSSWKSKSESHTISTRFQKNLIHKCFSFMKCHCHENTRNKVYLGAFAPPDGKFHIPLITFFICPMKTVMEPLTENCTHFMDSPICSFPPQNNPDF